MRSGFILTTTLAGLLAGCTAAADSPARNRAACSSNADCVPAQCCHPSACVPKSAAPDCAAVACTMECRPGTLDCGNGRCECSGGSCRAAIRQPQEK